MVPASTRDAAPCSLPPGPEYLADLDALDPIPWDISTFVGHLAAVDEMESHGPDMVDLVMEHMRIRYRGELDDFDDRLRTAFDDLDSRGLLDDTLVVFWSDHGEAFNEHEHTSHAWTLHGPENDAIAFFWAKDIVPAAWAGPTTSKDIVPTILETQGIAIPPAVTGLPAGLAAADRSIFSFTIGRDGASQAVRQDGWKLIFNWRNELETYHIDADPQELTDLFDPAHPESLTLWNELRPRVEAAEPLAPEVVVTWPAL